MGRPRQSGFPCRRVVTVERIDDLLEKTSRTFALSLPLLPEPTRRELSVAYLLFRIADTFEDAVGWRDEQQIEALELFIELLDDPDPERASDLGARWAAEVPIKHAGYLELLADTGLVLEWLGALSPAARRTVTEHTIRTARGMADFVERSDRDGVLRLLDLEDLRLYCYTVAGIVGELSTELFLLDRPSLASIAEALRARAARFGEALQLVNILKDSAFDTDEGRCYLPPRLDRRAVFALARDDLGIAGEYTRLLQRAGAARGIVAFCALPVRLAIAALARVEQAGAGAKISRAQVAEIVAEMNRALDAGAPAVPGILHRTRG